MIGGLNLNEVAAMLAVVVILVLVFGATFIKRRPKHLNREYFKKRWLELQKFCASKDTWPLAVINADKLLDEALKKSHYKGKTMGERLVSAQHQLGNNDAVWNAHKLRNRLVHEDTTKLKEREVKQALVGFRNALKDLGAF
jgi:hypothetical protein